MTLGVALSVAVAALAAGLLVQRVALSEPDSATFSALRAATWLSRYRLVDSTFSVNGGPTVHGQCLQDWFVVAGRRRRGAVLRLDNGVDVLDVPPHTLTVSGGTAADRAVAPLVLLELGGCTRFLERRVETLAQQRRGLTLSGGSLGIRAEGDARRPRARREDGAAHGDNGLGAARARHEPHPLRARHATASTPSCPRRSDGQSVKIVRRVTSRVSASYPNGNDVRGI